MPAIFPIVWHTKTISHFIYILLQPVPWKSDERRAAKLLPWLYVCRLSGEWLSFH